MRKFAKQIFRILPRRLSPLFHPFVARPLIVHLSIFNPLSLSHSDAGFLSTWLCTRATCKHTVAWADSEKEAIKKKKKENRGKRVRRVSSAGNFLVAQSVRITSLYNVTDRRSSWDYERSENEINFAKPNNLLRSLQFVDHGSLSLSLSLWVSWNHVGNVTLMICFLSDMYIILCLLWILQMYFNLMEMNTKSSLVNIDIFSL